MGYFWYRGTGSTVWKGAQADQRDAVLRDYRPEFVTVLDASDAPQDDWGRDEYMKMKYSGPLYFDWDSNELALATQDFQSTLLKLQEEYGLNLKACRLFATGGRGFHLEIPQACFINKPTKVGYAHLPNIYREIAIVLATDTLDLKVYSGKQGRMWRCPNVNRNTGKDEPARYKVPLTVEQALAMTQELYDELCSEQRVPPELDEPELSISLNNLFITHKDIVDKTMSRVAKVKDESSTLKRFAGEPPAGLKLLMAGMHLNPDTGFNNIALQLAITASALGMTEAQFVEATEGLARIHDGDGSRYNTPARRREALRDRFYYVQGSPAYVFSYGGLRSICEDGFAPTELAPADAMPGADDGMAPDNVEDEANVEQTPEQEAALKAAELTLLEGVRVTARGILRKTPDGIIKLSDLALTKPCSLVATETHAVVGIEVDVSSNTNGKLTKHGRRVLPMDTFVSRQSFDKFASSVGCVFKGTDIQATVVRNILNNTAISKERITFGVPYEGLSLIQNPKVRGERSLVPVWIGSGPRPIITRRSLHVDTRVAYGDSADNAYEEDPAIGELMFQPTMAKKMTYCSDLADAPELEATPENIELLRHLFQMNEPIVMAQTIGWFVGCFHRAFYDVAVASAQFPILNVSGSAGSGKSTTVKLLNNMHYSQAKEEKNRLIVMASMSTAFSIKSLASASYSLPLILDEYKTSAMSEAKRRELSNALLAVYDGQGGTTAGVSDGSAMGSWRDVTSYKLKAPVCVSGETIDDTAAIEQRSVHVGFRDGMQTPRSAHLAAAASLEGKAMLSSLGASLLLATMVMPVDQFRARHEAALIRSQEGAAPGTNPRQINNLAILMASLEFLKIVLNMRGITELDGDVDALIDTLYSTRTETTQRHVSSEASKALNDISCLSRLDSESPLHLKEGTHYIVGEGWIEMDMREVFVRYQSWCRQTGNTSFYRSHPIFTVAMAKIGALLDKTCGSSPLKRSVATQVFRFDSQKLLEDGVEPFDTKSKPTKS